MSDPTVAPTPEPRPEPTSAPQDQLDITQFDRIYLPVQSRSLIHPYSDVDACSSMILCHKLEEICLELLG
jgi:hypothetical protein